MTAGDGGRAARSDAAVAVTVSRRLENHVGWTRWTVHVAAGRVLLCDDADDPVEQHVAMLVARAVPGVASVETTGRSRCPWHRANAAVRGPVAATRAAQA